MRRDTFKIIIAGHVDHGKSTLTGRLLLDTRSLPKGKMDELKRISSELGKDAELAYLADQLKEEREEERTIDTTQSFFKTPERNYVVIDVPGHVEFIKNMITGATLADSAVLLVDAKRGIEAQTRRHAYIVDMLGLGIDIAVFNKMDLLDYSEKSFSILKEGFSKFMESLGARVPLIIPISAKDGENISRKSRRMRWYKGPCLAGALDSLKTGPAGTKKPLRFSIQDIYEIGEELIVAGKVLSGEMRKNQKVKLFPSLKNARIDAIKTFGGSLKKAAAGENIGLVLDDPSFAKRGEVICEEKDPPRPIDRFRTDVFWMSDAPLEIKKPLVFRCSTQEAGCVAEKIEKRINSSTFEVIEENASELKLNEAGVVVFRADRPVVVEKFDFIEELGRFVIEAAGEVRGAGIIREPLRQNRNL